MEFPENLWEFSLPPLAVPQGQQEVSGADFSVPSQPQPQPQTPNPKSQPKSQTPNPFNPLTL